MVIAEKETKPATKAAKRVRNKNAQTIKQRVAPLGTTRKKATKAVQAALSEIEAERPSNRIAAELLAEAVVQNAFAEPEAGRTISTEVTEPVAASQISSPWGLVRPDELSRRPPREYLIEGFIACREVGFLIGPSQVGKSLKVFDLGVAASQGITWAGFEIKKPFGTVYIAAEGGPGLRERSNAVHSMQGASLVNPRFLMSERALNLSDPAAKNGVDAFISEFKARPPEGLDLGLIVIDTMRASAPEADENSSKDVHKIVRSAYKLAHELDCAVMIVHHTGKDGAVYRGSSAIISDVDYMHVLSPSNGAVEMRVDKRKDGGRWTPRRYKIAAHEESAVIQWLDEEDWTTADKPLTCDDRVRSALEVDAERRWTVRELAENLGEPVETVRSGLKRLVEAGDAEETKVSAKVVHYSLGRADDDHP